MSSLERELALERELELRRARDNFLTFVQCTMPNYEVNWHHRVIASALERVAKGLCKRLVVTCPPRHGKSQLVSMHFPAFLLGVNPKAQIIAASYNATLAAKMNRAVQRVIDSPRYKSIFPGTELNSSNVRTVATGNWLRNSDEFEVVGHGGVYRSAGVGGSATGYGMTCFFAGAKVETENGAVPIEDFWQMSCPPKVWSYNFRSGRRELRQVTAVARSRHTEKVSVRFPDGSFFACTPGHLVYTKEVGFRPADTCDASTNFVRAEGVRKRGKKSPILHPLPGSVEGQEFAQMRRVRQFRSPSYCCCSMPHMQKKEADGLGGIYKKPSKKEGQEVLLQSKMLRRAECDRSEKGHSLPVLRAAGPSPVIPELHVKKVLQASVQDSRASGQNGAGEENQMSCVPTTFPLPDSRQVLQHGVQEQRAFSHDVWKVQSRICGRAMHNFAVLQSHIQDSCSVCPKERQPPLCVLRPEKDGVTGARPSHKRKKERQSNVQSNHVLRQLPFAQAPLAYAQAENIERHSQKAEFVYDLQVEGCANYFVEKTLVHNCGIVDDPTRNRADASSPTYQQRLMDWFQSTFFTRLEKDGALIIVLTRWSERDLVGQLLELAANNEDADQWEVLNLPAIAEEEKHPEDLRQTGEALWPGKYDLRRLERIAATIGQREFVSLYMQRPAPASGAIIKVAHIQWYDELPADLTDWTISVDLTFEDREDYAAFGVFARSGSRFYVVDMVEQRLEFTGQLQMFSALCGKYPQATTKLVESAANGAALIDTLRKKISGIIPIKPRTSKENRAAAVSPIFEAGNFFVPRKAAWADKYVVQLTTFPASAHDDMVDVTTQFLLRAQQRSADYTKLRGFSLARADSVDWRR